MKNLVINHENYMARLILSVLLIVMNSALFAVHAQGKWTLEFRPSLDFPTKNVAGSKLNIGFGFDGQLGYRFMPHLSVYGGWGWNLFPQDKSRGYDFSNEEASVRLRNICESGFKV
jgi:hypothetical protein